MSKLQAIIAGALLLDMGYAEDDREIPPSVVTKVEATAAAVAGALPKNAGLDFLTVMETWGESETNTTAALLDLAISATLKKVLESRHGHSPSKMAKDTGMAGVGWSAVEANTITSAEITITSAELRAILEQYEVERTETDGSWTLRLQKLSELGSVEG